MAIQRPYAYGQDQEDDQDPYARTNGPQNYAPETGTSKPMDNASSAPKPYTAPRASSPAPSTPTADPATSDLPPRTFTQMQAEGQARPPMPTAPAPIADTASLGPQPYTPDSGNSGIAIYNGSPITDYAAPPIGSIPTENPMTVGSRSDGFDANAQSGTPLSGPQAYAPDAGAAPIAGDPSFTPIGSGGPLGVLGGSSPISYTPDSPSDIPMDAGPVSPPVSPSAGPGAAIPDTPILAPPGGPPTQAGGPGQVAPDAPITSDGTVALPTETPTSPMTLPTPEASAPVVPPAAAPPGVPTGNPVTAPPPTTPTTAPGAAPVTSTGTNATPGATDLLSTLLSGVNGTGPGSELQTATNAAALKQLNSPSPYNSDEVKQEYDSLAGGVDADYDQRQRGLDNEMARRGLWGSVGKDFASGRAADTEVGRRTAKTSLARDLAQQYATTAGQYGANAISQGQAGANAANANKLNWVNALAGYGDTAFNHDLETAKFNAGQNMDYQKLLEEMLAAGYGG